MTTENQKETTKQRGGLFVENALVSDGSLGWQVRMIRDSNDERVTLDDGVSFNSPCFAGARPGDLWAVKHEPGVGCFGQIRKAVLLEPAGR